MNGKLLFHAQQGDANAFEALCAPYEGMVYRECLRMLSHAQDAEDAAQDAMIRAYRALPHFHGDSTIATWLYRIAHNVCLDRLKSAYHQKKNLSLEALLETENEPAGEQYTPEEFYLAQVNAELLKESIATLSDEDQVLLSLRYGDSLSYEELAKALHMRVGTVKSRLNRIKNKLTLQLSK